MPKDAEKFTDEDLVKMICGQVIERDKALHYIFVRSGWLNEAMNNLKKQGVNLQDAKDAVQEAFIVLDKKVRDGKYKSDKSLKNYFFGICNGRIYSNRRSVWRIGSDENMPVAIIDDNPETEMVKTEKKTIIRKLLNQLDDKCRDVLTHYMLSFSMKEIRELMNLKNENTTRKLAFDCRLKLAELIDKNPTLKRYLKN